jgi:hypothetical protein
MTREEHHNRLIGLAVRLDQHLGLGIMCFRWGNMLFIVGEPHINRDQVLWFSRQATWVHVYAILRSIRESASHKPPNGNVIQSVAHHVERYTCLQPEG